MERVEPHRRYTVEEYFQIEAASQERHDYLDGHIIPRGDVPAMSGGWHRHSLIIANLVVELGSRLKGKPCRVFESNLRVRIGRRVQYAYPDLGIYCGQPVLEDVGGAGEVLSNPRVIIEVLSPSTAQYDLGGKFEAYLEIDSLEEYLLVSQDHPRIQSFLRQPDGTWSLAPTPGHDAVARVRCLQLDLPLRDVYAGVEFEQPLEP